MANRFRKHGKAYFEFITTPGIGPTNNVAEQAIRFIVIDRHVTQGTRSIKGRKSCERLWTVIATCALQGRSAFNFILKAVKAYFQDQPSPSLLPGSLWRASSRPESSQPISCKLLHRSQLMFKNQKRISAGKGNPRICCNPVNGYPKWYKLFW